MVIYSSVGNDNRQFLIPKENLSEQVLNLLSTIKSPIMDTELYIQLCFKDWSVVQSMLNCLETNYTIETRNLGIMRSKILRKAFMKSFKG